jgi:hypothetical protein
MTGAFRANRGPARGRSGTMQAHGRVGAADDGALQRAIAGMRRMVGPDGRKGRAKAGKGRGSRTENGHGPTQSGADATEDRVIRVHGRAGATSRRGQWGEWSQGCECMVALARRTVGALRRDGTGIRVHGWGRRFDELGVAPHGRARAHSSVKILETSTLPTSSSLLSAPRKVGQTPRCCGEQRRQGEQQDGGVLRGRIRRLTPRARGRAFTQIRACT